MISPVSLEGYLRLDHRFSRDHISPSLHHSDIWWVLSLKHKDGIVSAMFGETHGGSLYE